MVPGTEIIERFESGGFHPADFHHGDHVELAWAYLVRHPLPVALEKVGRGLAAFAASAGKPERYHETITWAFVLIVHDRMSRRPGADFATFRRENGDLFDEGESVLARYYAPETLRSDRARSTFVWPDLGQRFSTS